MFALINKKSIKFLFLIASFGFLGSAHALKITNYNDACESKSYDIEVEFYIPDTWASENANTAEACWGHVSDSINHVYLEYGKTIGTGIPDKNHAPQRVCLIAKIGSQIYAINPVVDVPECEIEFIKVRGNNSGTLRATEACQFKGNNLGAPTHKPPC